MRSEDEVRRQLAWAMGMLGKHAHAYDAGYADALAWVLGQPAPGKGAEGPEPERRP